MENLPEYRLDFVLDRLPNEGWAHNLGSSAWPWGLSLADQQKYEIDFERRKLAPGTKLVFFSLRNSFYDAHRILFIASKRAQLWINIDWELSYMPQLIEKMSEDFIIARIAQEDALILLPKSSERWQQLFER